MIKRIYIDNFRCFSNFELEPSRMTLLLGANGSGKTSLFELIARISALVVRGVEIGSVFPTPTISRWDRRGGQRFELDVHDGTSRYRYELKVEHDRKREAATIAREVVTREGLTLFRFEEGTVHLHNNEGIEGTSFPFGGTRSFLAETEERDETRHLRWFLAFMARLWVLKLDPATMDATSFSESDALAMSGTNFASWYRHLQQEAPEGIGAYFAKLREVLPGFRALKVVKVSSRTRELIATFDLESQEYSVAFAELSDGQRVLIVLYALLLGLGLDGAHRTLLLDEPGNYLSLPEIQPCLFELEDALGDDGQLIVASHNSEVINHLASHDPMILDRKSGGPVRLAKGEFDRESGLKASEQIARGWLDDE